MLVNLDSGQGNLEASITPAVPWSLVLADEAVT